VWGVFFGGCSLFLRPASFLSMRRPFELDYVSAWDQNLVSWLQFFFLLMPLAPGSLSVSLYPNVDLAQDFKLGEKVRLNFRFLKHFSHPTRPHFFFNFFFLSLAHSFLRKEGQFSFPPVLFFGFARATVWFSLLCGPFF